MSQQGATIELPAIARPRGSRRRSLTILLFALAVVAVLSAVGYRLAINRSAFSVASNLSAADGRPSAGDGTADVLPSLTDEAPEQKVDSVLGKRVPSESGESTTPRQFAPAASRAVNAPAIAPSELTDLLKYLDVDYAIFLPYEARYFSALHDLLARQGIVGAQEGLDRTTFRAAVRRFQHGRGLPETGIPDKDTLWTLQVDWAKSRHLDLIKVPADKLPGRQGLDNFVLRADVVDQYNQFRAAIKALGGVVTSDGSMRDLSEPVTAGRSPTSLHYTGMALDVAIQTGMQDKDSDPYIVTKERDSWHVWARAEGGSEQTLDAVLWSKGQTRVEQVTATVIDFTAIAHQYGFQNLVTHSCFPASYSCSEWWHLSSEAAFVPFISQLGTELLSLNKYPESKLQTVKPIWDNRKFILESQAP